MSVLESSTIGKHGDPLLNEDGLFVGQRYLAVVDGVTSKAEYDLWHPSPGVVAKDLLLAVLRDLDSGKTSASANGLGMRCVQQKLDGTLRTAYATHPERSERFFVEHPNERLQANAVVYGVREREIWLFGDCSAIVSGRQIPTMKKVDVLLGEVLSFVAMTCENENTVSDTSDPGRQAILPLLRAQSYYANRPGEYGYFVFDGFTKPDWPVTSVPVDQGDEVVLASDGYPYLRHTLAESEEALATLHREDPQLIHRFRSTKGFLPGSDAFDDRTYLRFIA